MQHEVNSLKAGGTRGVGAAGWGWVWGGLGGQQPGVRALRPL